MKNQTIIKLSPSEIEITAPKVVVMTDLRIERQQASDTLNQVISDLTTFEDWVLVERIARQGVVDKNTKLLAEIDAIIDEAEKLGVVD